MVKPWSLSWESISWLSHASPHDEDNLLLHLTFHARIRLQINNKKKKLSEIHFPLAKRDFKMQVMNNFSLLHRKLETLGGRKPLHNVIYFGNILPLRNGVDIGLHPLRTHPYIATDIITSKQQTAINRGWLLRKHNHARYEIDIYTSWTKPVLWEIMNYEK